MYMYICIYTRRSLYSPWVPAVLGVCQPPRPSACWFLWGFWCIAADLCFRHFLCLQLCLTLSANWFWAFCFCYSEIFWNLLFHYHYLPFVVFCGYGSYIGLEESPLFCLQPRVNESILPFFNSFLLISKSLLGHLFGRGMPGWRLCFCVVLALNLSSPALFLARWFARLLIPWNLSFAYAWSLSWDFHCSVSLSFF